MPEPRLEGGDRVYRAGGTRPWSDLAAVVAVATLGFVFAWGVWNLFAVAWVAFSAALGLSLLRQVYEIRLSPDGTCVFRTLLRRVETRASLIRAVTARSRSLGGWSIGGGRGSSVSIEYEGGEATLMQPIDGTYDFVARIKERNPTIEVRGL